MADNLPNLYVPPALPGLDARAERVIRDLADRMNYLTTELDRVREMVHTASPGVDAARREDPQAGIVTIPYRDHGGQDGFIRVNKDGVIQSYVNPIEGLFPYVDLTVVGNVTTGLDQLHTFTLPANTLSNDGDILWVRYGGTFAPNDNDKRIEVQFDGVVAHGTGLFDQDSGTWVYDFMFTRVSPVDVKYPMILHWSSGARDGAGTTTGNFVFAGLFNGINVSNLNTTSVVIRLMAEGTATDDIQQGFSFITLIKPRTVKLV